MHRPPFFGGERATSGEGARSLQLSGSSPPARACLTWAHNRGRLTSRPRRLVMRARIIVLAVLAASAGWAAAAPAALAAPTCKTERGGATRCNTPGAMPVGWVMSDAQRQRVAEAAPPPASLADMLPTWLFVVSFIG